MRLVALLLGVFSIGCGFQVGAGSLDSPPDTLVDRDGQDPPACVDGDTDNDGICNAADVCANGNDLLDDDDDDVPDFCDDWPCGARPATPGASVSWTNIFGGETENVTVSDVRVAGMNTVLMVVAPDATFTVQGDYFIHDCICLGCREQIQIGVFIPNQSVMTECLFDGDPQGNNNGTCDNGTTGNDVTVSLTAPTTEGAYDVRFRRAQGNATVCPAKPNWWDAVNYVPQPAETIARICVHTPN